MCSPKDRAKEYQKPAHRLYAQMEFARDSLGLYGQVNKRTRWMPWQLEAKKDVVACEKPGGAGKQALIPGCPNGETRPVRVITD